MDKLSYSLGMMLAENLKQQGFTDIQEEDLKNGLDDAFSGKQPQVSATEAQTIINDYFQNKQAETFKSNVEEGKQFLSENGKKEGVVTLPSGLQYKVTVEGSGAIPAATDEVTTHYEGRLLDGTIFDSSIKRGQPATFPVNGVIQGWQEALQLMPIGSKWTLYVPSELAYGERGAGQDIQPYSTLIFDIELLDKKPA